MLWGYDSYSYPQPFDNVVSLMYTLWPRSLTDILPPYTRSAQLVGDTEILTFDGVKLRAPISPCKVILAAFESSKITMSHPQASAPAQLIISTDSVIVTIKPNYDVLINGNEISDTDHTASDVVVQKNHLQIKVITPFFNILVSRTERVVTVEASRWTFGRVAGLFGTYDGELGNDRLTSTGEQAANLTQLVWSWQENQQCHTPAVSPVSPVPVTVGRMFHCYPLLGVWSRCSPLVATDPFISFCYVTASPCHAAQAYRAICTTKGIGPLFSRGC